MSATASVIPVVTRTVEVRGIVLPWERVENRGPRTLPDGRVIFADRPPRGTVLESGEVFIRLETLFELSEQDRWDSQFGSALLLGFHEGLALVKAGLAEQETRGGFHRTDALVEFLAGLDAESV